MFGITERGPADRCTIPPGCGHGGAYIAIEPINPNRTCPRFPVTTKKLLNQFRSSTGATSVTRNTFGQRKDRLYLTPFFTQQTLEQPQYPKVFCGHQHCVTGVPCRESDEDRHHSRSAKLRLHILLQTQSTQPLQNLAQPHTTLTVRKRQHHETR